MWQNATVANCLICSPEECGWIKNENRIEPLWFKGDPTPLLVEDIVAVELDENVDNDNDINIENNDEYDREDYYQHNDDDQNIDDNDNDDSDDDDDHNKNDNV